MERTVAETTLELDTPTDRLLIQRIVRAGMLIYINGDGFWTNNPIVVVDDLKTAIRIHQHAEEYAGFTYTNECHDQWIAQFDKPVTEEEAIAQCESLFCGNHWQKVVDATNKFKKDNSKLLELHPEYSDIQSEIDLAYETIPSMSGYLSFFQTITMFVRK